MNRGVFIDTTSGRLEFLIPDDVPKSLDNSGTAENAEVIRHFLYSWIALLSDSPIKSSGLKPLSLYVRFKNRIIRDGLKETILRFSSLVDDLLKSSNLMGGLSITGEFIDGFLDTPIAREYIEFHRSGDPSLLKYIHTFCVFGKKMMYSDPQLTSTAFRSWEQVEEGLSNVELSPITLRWLRWIMDGLVGPHDSKLIFPKFGPGAVYEPKVRGNISKSNNLKYDARLHRAFFTGYFAQFGMSAESGWSEDSFLGPMRNESSRDCGVSRLRFVPKTIKTARSICMETNTRMCFQQAYLSVLLRMMDVPPTTALINFKDQSRNRELAIHGSYSSEIDTIDLSAASDSVHIDLVRGIFPRRVLYFLLATRSSKVDVGDAGVPKIRTVNKFAPMGSALCFPVQSLVFASVVYLSAITYLEGGLLPEEPPSMPFIKTSFARCFEKEPYSYGTRWKKFQPAAVYGDDICVDRRLTPIVTGYLSSLGFTVNNSKSFTGSQAFRESCGGYYWNGEDVTPLYYRIPLHKEPTAEVFMSGLALCNKAGDLAYRSLQTYWVNLLKSKYRNVLFSDNREDPSSIFSLNAKNVHLKTRYNPDLQRDEVSSIAPVPAMRKYPTKRERNSHEWYLYQRWMASRIEGVVTPEIVSGAPRFDASGTRLRRRWTPL